MWISIAFHSLGFFPSSEYSERVQTFAHEYDER